MYNDQIAYTEAHSSGDPRYPFFIANYFKKIGDKEKELVYAKKAYDLSPDKQSFGYTMALAELNNGHPAEAIKYARHAYEVEPHNADALRYYTYISLEEGRTAAGPFDLMKLGVLAQVLGDAYTQYGQTLAMDPQFWAVFKEVKNGATAKKALANRLGQLIPEKKAVFDTLAK